MLVIDFLVNLTVAAIACLVYRAWANWQNLTAAALIFVTAFLLVSVGTLKARAGGDVPDVKSMMGRVEAVLVMQGFPKAKGYAALQAPAVTMVDVLPGNAWGNAEPGAIKISRAQPDGCVAVTLAHELAHDATVRMHLLDDFPGDVSQIKDEFERVARLVESFIASDGVWLPNCLFKRDR